MKIANSLNKFIVLPFIFSIFFHSSIYAEISKIKNETTKQVFTDLQTAINAASPNDVLDLYGEFFITGNPFIIQKSLTLKGIQDTVLDGNNINTVLLIQESLPHSVFVTLENLTIQNGNSSNSGGGIDNNATLTLKRIKVTKNNANGFGGGIFNHIDSAGGPTAGFLTLIKSTVCQNTARDGGGIATLGLEPEGDTVSSLSTLIINRSKIINNGAIFSGGGIFSDRSSNTLINFEIESNSCGTNGGGFSQNEINNTTMSYGKIIENFASSNGGGIYSAGNEIEASVTISIEYTSIYKNRSLGLGGGLMNQSGSAATIRNSSIKYNQASNGGGIFNTLISSLNIINSVLKHNSPNDLTEQ